MDEKNAGKREMLNIICSLNNALIASEGRMA